MVRGFDKERQVNNLILQDGVVLVRDVLYHSLHWDKNYVFRMDNEFRMECLRRLRRRRKICLRQSILCLDLCAAAPGRSFACAGDLPQILHGFHPGCS